MLSTNLHQNYNSIILMIEAFRNKAKLLANWILTKMHNMQHNFQTENNCSFEEVVKTVMSKLITTATLW